MNMQEGKRSCHFLLICLSIKCRRWLMGRQIGNTQIQPKRSEILLIFVFYTSGLLYNCTEENVYEVVWGLFFTGLMTDFTWNKIEN